MSQFPTLNNPAFIEEINENDRIDDDIDNSEIRRCDRKVDLYVLQPDKLNTSGQNSPLKGKLTNCHITGCER